VENQKLRRKRNWQSWRAQVDSKTEVVTAVCYHGSFIFLSWKVLKGKFYIFTTNYKQVATLSSGGTLAISFPKRRKNSLK